MKSTALRRIHSITVQQVDATFITQTGLITSCEWVSLLK